MAIDSLPLLCVSESVCFTHSIHAAGAQVDLGPNQTTLEQFYYGCQYLIGSSARAGKNAPALDAAFETSAAGDEMFVLNCESMIKASFPVLPPQSALCSERVLNACVLAICI